MRKQYNQAGSVHVVVTVALVLALLGALGFIFYQNFIVKKADSVNQTNQTKNDSTQQTGNNTTPVKTVSKKDFCTELEKLCFTYPEDWSVTAKAEMGTLSQTTPTMDQVQIKNKSGETYLYISTGISGIGGTCDPAETAVNTIIETHTTSLSGDYLLHGLSDQFSSTAYAVKYVGPIKYGSGTYTAGMSIMAEKAVAAPGKVNGCSFGYQMFASKAGNGSVRFGTVGFMVSGETTPRSFSSYDDAVKFLNTDDAKTAYDILVSVRYK